MFARVRSPSASCWRVVTKGARAFSSRPSGRFAPSLTIFAVLSRKRAIRSSSGRGMGTVPVRVFVRASAAIMPRVDRWDKPSVRECSSRLPWATFSASARAAMVSPSAFGGHGDGAFEFGHGLAGCFVGNGRREGVGEDGELFVGEVSLGGAAGDVHQAGVVVEFVVEQYAGLGVGDRQPQTEKRAP